MVPARHTAATAAGSEGGRQGLGQSPRQRRPEELESPWSRSRALLWSQLPSASAASSYSAVLLPGRDRSLRKCQKSNDKTKGADSVTWTESGQWGPQRGLQSSPAPLFPTISTSAVINRFDVLLWHRPGSTLRAPRCWGRRDALAGTPEPHPGGCVRAVPPLHRRTPLPQSTAPWDGGWGTVSRREPACVSLGAGDRWQTWQQCSGAPSPPGCPCAPAQGQALELPSLQERDASLMVEREKGLEREPQHGAGRPLWPAAGLDPRARGQLDAQGPLQMAFSGGKGCHRGDCLCFLV